MSVADDPPHQQLAVVKPAPRAMSVSEAARRWNVSRTTARKRLDLGRLPDLGEPVEIQVPPPLSPPVTPGRHPALHFGDAVAVALLAMILAGVGICLNASFLFAFGRTTDAGVLLAALGLTIDGLTLVLPSAVTVLWAHGRYAWAVTGGAVATLAFGMTLLATSGFVTMHVGDAVSARSATAAERVRAEEEVARLKARRQVLVFMPAIEDGVASARSAVAAAATAREGECRRRGDLCRAREADEKIRLIELNAAVANKVAADEAAALETQVRDAEERLADLPAVGAADPQVEGATALVMWVFAGSVRVTGHDVAMIRAFGLTISPALAGLLFALALVLAQSGGRPR
jgi:hypothetical protein